MQRRQPREWGLKINAEARLIAAVCVNKDMPTLLNADLDEMFVTHEDIWVWLKSYYLDYQAVPDTSIVKEKFPDFESEVTTEPTRYYLDELRNTYIDSRMSSIIQQAAKSHGKMAGSELVQKLLRSVNSLADKTNIVKDKNIRDYESAKDDYVSRKAMAEANGGTLGIRTGFKTMDEYYVTGMAPGHSILVIGWSGHGKSWMGSLLAARAWAEGRKVLYVSLEMTPEEVRDRIYTILGSGTFKHSDFARGNVDPDAFEAWASGDMENYSDFVVMSTEGMARITPATVQAKIDQYKPDIVINDYLQLFDSDQEGNETVRVRSISKEFKRMAHRNGIPIVNLAQATFNDPKDTQSAPMIEQVAWAKGIQHDTDFGIAVHKFSDSNEWEVICRKNRHGEEFAFGIDWDLNIGVLEEKALV